MIEFSFAFTTTLVVVLFLTFRLCVNLKQKAFSWKAEALQLLYLVNLAVISRFVFHPMDLVDGQIQPLVFDAAAIYPIRLRLVPFVSLFDYETMRELLLNVIGNFAMFIPTGIVTPILYRKLRSFKKTLLTGFLISLSIEIIQLPFSIRCSDVNDLILNTAGVAVGYGIYALVKGLKSTKEASI